MNMRQSVCAFAASVTCLATPMRRVVDFGERLALQAGAEQYTGDRGYAGQHEITFDSTCPCGLPTARCIPSEEDGHPQNLMLHLLSMQE
jgi:hypothetical protein